MNGILQMTSSVDGGIHEGEFYTLNAVNTPSIILSLGYLSNITDANILRDEQYRFAHGIYRGMLEFFGFI